MLHKDNENTLVILYSVIFFFFAACFVVPPTEFVSAGVTIQSIFSGWLGSEGFNFIYYHIKRTTLTLVIHSFIPLAYYCGLHLFAPQLGLLDYSNLGTLWTAVLSLCLILPGLAIITAYYWCRNNYTNHPLVKQLSRLAGENETWQAVASSINIEFRRVDKFTTGTPSRLIAVTDSWIIKCCTYHVYVSHQRDIHLTVAAAEEHPLSYQNQSAVQYLNIAVGGIEGATSFTIRLNAFELGDLKEKLRSPIRIARDIVIHQTLTDLFLSEFREYVAQNPTFRPPPDMEIETCIGCMQKQADVKLNRRCRDADGETDANSCQRCFCRPMWCLECMGKWFVSRQNQQEPELWMSSQSPCPTCRATFCVFDVCPLP